MKYHTCFLIIWLLAILITVTCVGSFVPLSVQCVLLGAAGGAIRSLRQLVSACDRSALRLGEMLWMVLRPIGSATSGWCAWGSVVLGLRLFALDEATPQPVSTMLMALTAGYLIDRWLRHRGQDDREIEHHETIETRKHEDETAASTSASSTSSTENS